MKAMSGLQMPFGYVDDNFPVGGIPRHDAMGPRGFAQVDEAHDFITFGYAEGFPDDGTGCPCSGFPYGGVSHQVGSQRHQLARRHRRKDLVAYRYLALMPQRGNAHDDG